MFDTFVDFILFWVHFNKQVEWSQKDGDFVHKGLKIGRVYGKLGYRNLQLHLKFSRNVVLQYLMQERHTALL